MITFTIHLCLWSNKSSPPEELDINLVLTPQQNRSGSGSCKVPHERHNTDQELNKTNNGNNAPSLKAITAASLWWQIELQTYKNCYTSKQSCKVNVTEITTASNVCVPTLTCEPWYMQAFLEGET